MRFWSKLHWSFGRTRVVVHGRAFPVPRWLLQSLRDSHALKQDLNETLRLLDAWNATADITTGEVRNEILLLCEMPLSNLRAAAQASLKESIAVQERGIHCRQMLADHTSDLVSHMEYGLGRALKKPLRSRDKLLQELRELHEALVSLAQDVEAKIHELATDTEQLRKLL